MDGQTSRITKHWKTNLSFLMGFGLSAVLLPWVLSACLLLPSLTPTLVFNDSHPAVLAPETRYSTNLSTGVSCLLWTAPLLSSSCCCCLPTMTITITEPFRQKIENSSNANFICLPANSHFVWYYHLCCLPIISA